MKKKIGIITSHFTINYGAVLQAYALHELINKLGKQPFILDFRLYETRYGNRLPKRFSSFKQLVSILFIRLNPAFLIRRERKIKKFNDFINENFNLIKFHPEQADKKIIAFVQQLDAICCGSDQIWNPNLFSNPIYKLSSPIINGIKKYSYAASIAEKISKDELDRLVSQISDFSGISLRESLYLNEIRSGTKLPVEKCLDPSLVIGRDFWIDVVSDCTKTITHSSKYILVFDVAGPSLLKESVKRIREKLGLPVVCLSTSPINKFSADEVLFDLGPIEFLKVIKDASFVVTSSYHAMIFSIVFRKDFILCAGEKRFSRHSEVLSMVGLKERAIFDSDDITSCLSNTIDYDIVENEPAYKSSVEFSKSFINGIGN